MTHAELVERAGRWLKSKGHGVVVTEYRFYSEEEPDAIGFKSGWTSTLVECKASRSDFKADQKKICRREPHLGLGLERWYMTPPALIQPDELPENWGLLEVHGRRVKVIKKAERFTGEAARIAANDRGVLYSIARRAVIRGFDPKEKLGEAKPKE